MIKPNIFIISGPHLDIDRKLSIGGLEKYIDTLATKLASSGYKVYFHEISLSGDFEIERNGFINVGHNLPKKFKTSIPKIEKYIQKMPYYSPQNDVVIYSTDYLAKYNFLSNSIAIQHGIAWDIPFEEKSFKNTLKPHFLFMSKVNILKKIDRLICVDYNYPNWLRATFPYKPLLNKIKVIPNFTAIKQIEPRHRNKEDELKICFARRFEDYRGALIFGDAICLLSNKPFFDKLSFTFAGNGKLENYLRKKFENFKNVYFERYDANNSIDFHSNFDIAVIPTIGSEGTSLSALEAMSAGCAVLCTGVGGLSNIVIDQYNGIIIQPSSSSIADSIETLFYNQDLISFLSNNGHLVAKASFDEKLWFDRWTKVIEEFSDNENNK